MHSTHNKPQKEKRKNLKTIYHGHLLFHCIAQLQIYNVDHCHYISDVRRHRKFNSLFACIEDI